MKSQLINNFYHTCQDTLHRKTRNKNETHVPQHRLVLTGKTLSSFKLNRIYFSNKLDNQSAVNVFLSVLKTNGIFGQLNILFTDYKSFSSNSRFNLQTVMLSLILRYIVPSKLSSPLPLLNYSCFHCLLLIFKVLD